MSGQQDLAWETQDGVRSLQAALNSQPLVLLFCPSPSWRDLTRSISPQRHSFGALHQWHAQRSYLNAAWWSPTRTRPQWVRLCPSPTMCPST